MRRADPVKIDLVRDEILRAGMSLFQKYGLDKTTMEDIAEAAEKGKSTLYYYFKKKEDVFHSIAEREMSSMVDALENGLKAGKNAGDKIGLFFLIQDKSLRSKMKLYPMIFKETNKHIQLFQSLQRMANTMQTKMFKTILLEGIESGEFKSISREECNTVAVTVVSTLHAMQLNVLLEGKMPTNEAKLKIMHQIMARGLK
ncbi:MAG TPA: TetR/AcrR family transcriptional regulator [Elusimicrobiales bacterium]|nr:TetR/AcrR family transcriptional regulator [Elusimicrobiales bacterium]